MEGCGGGSWYAKFKVRGVKGSLENAYNYPDPNKEPISKL